MAEDMKLRTGEVAMLLGLSLRTVQKYHHHAVKERTAGRDRFSLFPPPDGRFEGSGWPWWWRSTIEGWQAVRPGAGARTDRYAPGYVPTGG